MIAWSPAHIAPRRGAPLALQNVIGVLPPDELLALKAAGATSVAAFARATRRYGSLLQCWIRGRAVVEFDHYPADDVVDVDSGAQYFYHAHRSAAAEHGHLHLFWRGDASGRRVRRPARKSAWAPTHLAAIGLTERGLPVSLFTVNRWVTAGLWFDAQHIAALLARFEPRARGPCAPANRWLATFVRMYLPVLGPLLVARDERVTRLTQLRSWEAVASDRRIEVLSRVTIDWARDLDALESELARRATRPPR